MTSAIPQGFRALPLPLAQLSLAAVLKCGQSFRWSIYPLFAGTPSDPNAPTHEYRLCLRDRVVCLRQLPDTLLFRTVLPEPTPSPTQQSSSEAETLAWLNDYFQLDIDLVKLYDEWSRRDPVFARFRDRFEGIRMLRQDPWENLISFICSSNNNIARITKMVTALCSNYSPVLLSLDIPLPDTGASQGLFTPGPRPEEIEQERHNYYPFPPPSRLARPEVSAELRKIGFGYRADFIQKTAKMLVEAHGTVNEGDLSEPPEKWLMTLRDLPTAEARTELLKLMGVGRKVADCILLMSLDKREVVPVDTHVHQIAIKHYGMRGSSGTKQTMSPKLYDEVNNKLTGVWGEYAGWAHSVLFTADLKSFSSYGLPTPASTPSKHSSSPALVVGATSVALPTPPLTPLEGQSSSRKRGRKAIVALPKPEEGKLLTDADNHDDVLPTFATLAERVKRRRRT